MKTMKIIALLIMAGVLVSSCKDEDNGTPKQLTKTFTFKGDLRGTEEVNGSYSFDPLLLSTVIGEDAADNLTSAEQQIAQSYMMVEGLTDFQNALGEVVTLKDLTVTVGSASPVLLGDCKVSPSTTNEFGADQQLSTTKFVNVVTEIFDALESKKSVTVKVGFTPSHSITSSDNVKIVFGFGGVFNYVVYE